MALRGHEFGNALRAVALVTSLALGAGALSGCDPQKPEDSRSSHDRKSACMTSGLEGDRSLTQTLDVPGEAFDLEATFSTEYDTDSWKVTDTKSLDINLAIKANKDQPLPELMPDVQIENFHADASLKAKKSAINGIMSDSFDDRMHTGTQSGFAVTTEHPYMERFIIGGYTQFLTEGWGYYTKGYGTWTEEEKRLTEKNLKKRGAYGQEISYVVDVLTKQPTDPYFHKSIAAGSFIVPLAGKGC